MQIFLWIFFATTLISLVALIGIFTLSLKQEFLDKILLRLVALSSGAMLGGAFIHLLPEGIDAMDPKTFSLIVLAALILYFLIEKFLHWRHCHKGKHCAVHSFGYLNLIGDAVHNFIDGLIIAGAFIVSLPLGLSASLAIALHEIPQEIGDFGILLYAGFKKKRALYLNFMASLTVVLGGIIGWALSSRIVEFTKFLLPIAVGGFIYIALSDLIPELRKESNMRNFLINFGFLLLGVALMYII